MVELSDLLASGTVRDVVAGSLAVLVVISGIGGVLLSGELLNDELRGDQEASSGINSGVTSLNRSAVQWTATDDLVTFRTIVPNGSGLITRNSVHWVIAPQPSDGHSRPIPALLSSSVDVGGQALGSTQTTMAVSPVVPYDLLDAAPELALYVHIETGTKTITRKADLGDLSAQSGGEFSKKQGELSTTAVDRNKGPHYSIPSNNYRIFYSEDIDGAVENASVNYSDQEFGEIRSIRKIREGADQGEVPYEWSLYYDASFLTASPDLSLYGWDYDRYQREQLAGIQTDASKSIVFGPADVRTKEYRTIKDAYVRFVGFQNGTLPVFGSGSGKQTPFVGRNGSALTYLDYRLDDSQVPSTDVEDPVTYNESGGDKYQLQTRYRYDIESHSATRQLTAGNSNAETGSGTSGMGGGVTGYTLGSASEARFTITGEIESQVYRYTEQRRRDWVTSFRDTLVQASTETSAQASQKVSISIPTFGRDEGESISTEVDYPCSTDAEAEATTTITRDWERTITREVTITVSGTISGTCTGTLTGEASGENYSQVSGTVSGEISGTVTGTEVVTIEYEHWGAWGPWDLKSKRHHRTDRVTVRDSLTTYIPDNNEIEVSQTAIQVEEDRYHVLLDISYPQKNGEPIKGNRLNQFFLWSLIRFSDGVYLESDWKTYSRTRWASGRVRTEDGTSIRSTPNVLNMWLYSETNGPTVQTINPDVQYNPILKGYTGTEVSVQSNRRHPHVALNSGFPVLYEEIVIEDVPRPAQEMVSVTGTTKSIEDTKVIPYVTPRVNISYVNGTVTVTVRGKDGKPLAGRNLRISTGRQDQGTFTTNSEGRVQFTTDSRFSYVQVRVASDDYRTVLKEDRDVYYGSVTARKTVGTPAIVDYLVDSMFAALLGSPLILLWGIIRHFDLLR